MLVSVAVEIFVRVVDCHSAFDFVVVLAFIAQLSIWVLGDSFVGAVFVSEIHGGCPIVAVF